MGTMHRPKATNDKALHFYSSVCQYCFDASGKVKVCSSCCVMPYCSRAHQALDWPFHKVLCKAIRTSNRKLPYAVSNNSELTNYRIVLKMAWECSLKRQLTAYESTVLLHLPYCNVCYVRRNLLHCDGCRCVSYCTEEHRRSDVGHLRHCDSLRLCLKVDCEALSLSGPFGQFRLFETVPQNIDEFVEKARNNSFSTHFCSYLLSYIGTIIYLLQNTPANRALDLHVIGASSHEDVVDWTYCGELLQNLFDVDSIKVSLIGPEVNAGLDRRTGGVTVSRHKRLYHDAVEDLTMPTGIVAFNAGIRAYAGEEGDTWRDTIPHLLRENVPLLVTGYTEEEARTDENCMLGHSGVRSIVGCTENPFRSRKPIRNPITVGERPFYSNYYVFICRRDL